MRRREHAVAFVVARLGSRRLSAKHLRPIGDRILLDWVVERLRASTEVDEIVIATVAEPENEPLRAFARERGIGCFWYEGDAEHVTTRLRRAAEVTGADICVLVSADSPLTHTPGVDLLVSELRAAPGADVVGGCPRPGDRPPPLLAGVVVARKRGWQIADDLSDTPELRRHQFPIIPLQEERFRIHHFALPPWYYQKGPRLSVDTWADLEFMNAVHDRLRAVGEEFDLGSVLRLLEREPHWASLNAHVHQRRTEEVSNEVLFVVDAGAHRRDRLLRSRELALQIVERKSWPVRFVVDDDEARRTIEARGLTASWGALDRAAAPPPPGERESSLLELSREADLVLLDLDPDRELEPGWRHQLAEECEVAVLGARGEWTKAADRRLSLSPDAVLDRDVRRVLEECRRRGRTTPTKTTDLLTDLVDPDRLGAVRRFAERNGLSLVELATRTRGFPRELARARVWISSREHDFPEALALGTRPFAWTGDPEESRRVDELAERLELSPPVLRRESDLYLLHSALASPPASPPLGVDATQELIESLASVDSPRADRPAA